MIQFKMNTITIVRNEIQKPLLQNHHFQRNLDIIRKRINKYIPNPQVIFFDCFWRLELVITDLFFRLFR